MSTKKLAGLSMLAALSIAIVSIFHVPIFPVVSFLEFDFADIPIFLATFMYGPSTGLLLTFVVSVIQGLTVSAHSGIFGIIMHFAATGSYVIAAGLIYKRHRTLKGALAAIAAGIIVWVTVMIGFNLAITPLFMKISVNDVVPLLGFITAFNVIKAGANSCATFIIYKSMHKVFARYFDANGSKNGYFKRKKEQKSLKNAGKSDEITQKSGENQQKNIENEPKIEQK